MVTIVLVSLVISFVGIMIGYYLSQIALYLYSLYLIEDRRARREVAYSSEDNRVRTLLAYLDQCHTAIEKNLHLVGNNDELYHYRQGELAALEQVMGRIMEVSK